MATTVLFNLRMNSASFEKGGKKAENSIKKLNKTTKNSISIFSSMTKKLAGVAVGLAKFGAIAGSIGLGKAVKDTADFEETLIRIKAVSKASKDEMKFLTKMIKDLGLKTQFTVKDIGEAVFNLSTLGIKGKKAFQELMPSVVNAAVALDVDLNEAAKLVLGTMKMFGKETKDVTKVVDILVGAYTNSSLNAEKFQIAMQYAGFTANAFGREIEDIVPLIMKLSDSQLDASIAGTQMRSAFSTLIAPSRKARKVLEEMGLTQDQLNVRSLGFIKVLENLAKAGLDEAKAFTIFGKRAAAPVLSLIAIDKNGQKGIDTLKKFQAQITVSGEGARQAAERQKGLAFSFKQLWASISIVSIKIGEMFAKFTGLEGKTLSLVKGLTSFNNLLEKIDGANISFSDVFSIDQLLQNLNNFINKIVPIMVSLLGKAAGSAALTFVQTIIKNLPAIIKYLGTSLLKVFTSLVNMAIKAIISTFKTVFVIINSLTVSLMRNVAVILSSMPGMKGVAGRVRIAAERRNIQGKGFEVSIDNFSKSITKDVKDIGDNIADSFGKLVDEVSSVSSLGSDLVKEIQRLKADMGMDTRGLSDTIGKLKDSIINTLPTSKQRKAIKDIFKKEDKKTEEKKRVFRTVPSQNFSMFSPRSTVTEQEKYNRIVVENQKRLEERKKRFEAEMERQKQLRQERENRFREQQLMKASLTLIDSLMKDTPRGNENTQGGVYVDNRNQINHNFRERSKVGALTKKARETDLKGNTKLKRE